MIVQGVQGERTFKGRATREGQAGKGRAKCRRGENVHGVSEGGGKVQRASGERTCERVSMFVIAIYLFLRFQGLAHCATSALQMRYARVTHVIQISLLFVG